jgi:hypothetical protein
VRRGSQITASRGWGELIERDRLDGKETLLSRSLDWEPMTRAAPAGDFDYEAGGSGYAARRRADPRLEALVRNALGDADPVLNVGAGAGSYEPRDREVVAVEPSSTMRSQRPAELASAVDAVAEALPFDDRSFEAAMAMITVHQWPDCARGLAELVRVSTRTIVILTFDGDALDRLWLGEYAPELIAAERRRYPPIGALAAALPGEVEITEVPVPIDCVDGFTEAYYARPEAFLDPAIRRAQSAWGFVEPRAAELGLERLRADLDSGRWDERHGALREQPTFRGALRLIVSRR